jgi:hypothetical protein
METASVANTNGMKVRANRSKFMHVTTFPRFSVTQFTSLPNNQVIGHLRQQINAAGSM